MNRIITMMNERIGLILVCSGGGAGVLAAIGHNPILGAITGAVFGLLVVKRKQE